MNFKNYKDYIFVVFKSYDSILFLRDIKVGVFLLLVSFILPSVGFLGLVSLLSTIIFANFLNFKEYLKEGFYLYNSLLVGMGVGYYFDITLTTIFMSVMLGMLTFLLSFSLNKVFSTYYVPILSFPFALVSMIFYLASLKYTTLLSNILEREPLFNITINNELLSNFFKSLGTIFFLPYDIVGLIFFIILLIYSRILAFLAFLGFVLGVYVHSIFVGFYPSVNSVYNFNYILIAMAIGGVFLIANIRSYILAIVGVILSIGLIDSMEVFFTVYNLPVYTVPFNVIVILFLMLLYWSGYKYVNRDIKKTPEESLSYYLSNKLRFGGSDIKIYLPFYGKWSVYQEFDDKWTHKGPWKYAYDFVIKRNGKTYKNDGLFVTDYYCFGEDVYAPVSGYIVSMRNDLVDNFIGNVDKENNWGNYVIIKSDLGYYVEISHLMQYSILFKVGDYVKVGTKIAKCGNSGYSPEPHIHIQVQKYQLLGSETIPFKFVNYIQNNELKFYSLPKVNEEVENLLIDENLKLRLNFILDDVLKFEDDEKNIYEFKVMLDEYGRYYFSDGDNRLYFTINTNIFYFYDYIGKDSILKEIFKLAPKIPLINKNLKYVDYLPLEFRFNGMIRAFYEFLVSFYPKFFEEKIVYQKETYNIKSKYGEIELSFYEKGFKKIKLHSKTLRRINEINS